MEEGGFEMTEQDRTVHRISGEMRAVGRIRELRERVAVVQPHPADKWRISIENELADALLVAQSERRVDRVWTLIHSIEERVNARDRDLVHLGEQIGHHLANESDATARRAAQAEFDKLYKQALTTTADGLRSSQALERARSIIAESHARSRSKYDSARKTRIGLFWCSGVLIGIAVVALVAQSWSEEAFVPPPDSSSVSSTLLLALLLGAGALGGMLSALFSLYLTKHVEDTSWFDPRPALALTKVTVGAWASVIAALAVGTGALVGQYTSVPAALLVGVAFGYAQQALTGFLDKYAAGLTPSVSKTP
jgi:hypothetical protein